MRQIWRVGAEGSLVGGGGPERSWHTGPLSKQPKPRGAPISPASPPSLSWSKHKHIECCSLLSDTCVPFGLGRATCRLYSTLLQARLGAPMMRMDSHLDHPQGPGLGRPPKRPLPTNVNPTPVCTVSGMPVTSETTPTSRCHWVLCSTTWLFIFIFLITMLWKTGPEHRFWH